MSKKHKPISLTSLPFKSILDERPNNGQYILMAWEIRGYCGFESLHWDKDDFRCQHCTVWLPVNSNQLFSKNCAIEKSKRGRYKGIILKWHEHFSIIINNKYVSKSKLAKGAETI